MLRLTDAAAAELAELRQAQGLPDSFGLRVFGEPQSGGQLALQLAFTEVPAEDDEISEQQGTRVFVAPEVVDPLSRAALDVEQTVEGAKLVLTPQEIDEEL